MRRDGSTHGRPRPRGITGLMEPTELLRLVGERLDRLGCERFTTGSLASMVFGEPRFTNDIDIVVRMDEREARLLSDSFQGDDWYVSVDAAAEAARTSSSRQEATSMLHASPVSAESSCPTVELSRLPRPRT